MATLRTWYFDWDMTIKDELLETLSKYIGITKYLISHEEFNKEGDHKPHWHMYLYCDNIKTFNNFVKKLKKDYDLIALGDSIRKQTGKKGYRNWGVLKKEVYDEKYYATYIAKDGNIWGNYPKNEIQTFIDNSFKSKSETLFKEECYKYVKLNYLKTIYKDRVNNDQLGCGQSAKQTQIQLCIMDYMRENKSVWSKTKIMSHFNFFIWKNKEDFNLSQSYNLIFN